MEHKIIDRWRQPVCWRHVAECATGTLIVFLLALVCAMAGILPNVRWVFWGLALCGVMYTGVLAWIADNNARIRR